MKIALRAAKRLGSGEAALAKARIAGYHKAANTRALLEAVPNELHSDPGYLFSRIQLLRREEKFAEAAQLMMSAPKEVFEWYSKWPKEDLQANLARHGLASEIAHARNLRVEGI